MRAILIDVRFDGLILRVTDETGSSKEAWLPNEEWSFDSSDWDHAVLALDPSSEYEFDVVSLGRLREGRLVVSRRGVDLKLFEASATNQLPIREFVVRDEGRRVIHGTMGARVPAVVTGRYYQDYFNWISSKSLTQELADHAVLGNGDIVRGFVKGIDYGGMAPALTFNLSEYFEIRNTEIKLKVLTPQETEEIPQQEFGSPRKLAKDCVSRISPALLADDNECRESIAKVLRREGVEVHTVENTEQAQEFLDYISSDQLQSAKRSPEFRLAILDPNLKESSTDLIGLSIAEKLREKSNCRVIIMTGEAKNTNKLRQWPELGIHGYIEKPFTMDQLIVEIEDAIGLTKPVPLKKWIAPETEKSSKSQRLEGVRGDKETAEISITKELQSLGRVKAGAVIHVFDVHPRSFRARSLGSVNGSILKWEALRGKIGKSLIKDTAFGNAVISEGNATQDDPKHLWTLEMMTYRSFCGLPIQVEGKKIALVAFHPDRNAFDGAFFAIARVIGERVGRAIERELLYKTRGNEADLASFGMALAAIAHELASDMTGLNANIKALGDIVTDEESGIKKQEALGTLDKVRKNAEVITKKTRILRRTHVAANRVSIVEAMKKAATACVTVIDETIKSPERILIKEIEATSESWDVSASMASLMIVFFNLYLNAAQQIDLASSVRKYGIIWTSLSRFKDVKGKYWARARVHDSGPGIHRDDWERVFEPGYSTKPDGSGLGLYICRYLLKNFSANIAITSSAIWDGTTVTINIPLPE
jgi:signal transduction histidine kinase/DNA-binding response OmpR family regulator